MKQTYTAVVERAEPIRGVHESEPYEAGWADEALVFVKVRGGLSTGANVSCRVQISPDGINWVDHHAARLPSLDAEGLIHAPVRDFGNWLRVLTVCSDPDNEVRVSIYLVLKG